MSYNIQVNGVTYSVDPMGDNYTVKTNPNGYQVVPIVDLTPYLKIRNLIAGSGVTVNYTLTGVTIGASFNGSAYELKSIFNSYTGTTAPATYLGKSAFNSYSGTTVPATYVKKTVFNSFTGTTITGATNGLQKVGRHITLGGTLTTDTTLETQSFGFLIESSTNGTGFGIVDNVGTFEIQTANADLTISNDGTTPTIFTDSTGGQTGLQYAADYSHTYTARSLVDANFVTGQTSALSNYVTKTSYFGYTGTTAPATYLKKTAFNSYTASTSFVTGATNGLTKLSNKKVGLGGAISGNTNQQSVVVYSSPLSGSSNSLTLGINRSGGYYSPYFELIAGGANSTPPVMLLNNGSAYFSFQGGANPSQVGSLVTFTDGRSTTLGIQYSADYSAGFTPRSFVDKGYVTGNTITKTFFNTYTGTTAGVSKSLFNSYTGTTAPATFESKTAFNTYTASTTNVTSANNGLTKSGNNVHLGGALTGATRITLGSNTLTITGSTGQFTLASTGNLWASGIMSVGSANASGMRYNSGVGLDLGQVTGGGGGGFNIRFADNNYSTFYAAWKTTGSWLNTSLTVGNTSVASAALSVKGAISASNPTIQAIGYGTTTNKIVQLLQSDGSTEIMNVQDSGVITLNQKTSGSLITAAYTASTNNTNILNIGGVINARATASDTLFGVLINPTMNARASTQTLKGLVVSPSFQINSTTNYQFIPLEVSGGSSQFQFATGNVAGNNNVPTLIINRTSSSGDQRLSFRNAGTESAYLNMNTGGEVRLLAGTGGYFLTFYANNSEVYRATANGNIQLGLSTGDTATSARLQVRSATLGTPVQRIETKAAAGSTNPNRTTYQNKLLTTGATVTTIQSIAIASGTTTQISGKVTARRTGGASGSAQDGAGFTFDGVFSNTGSTKIIGTPTINVVGRDQAGWNVTLTKNASNLLIQVNGSSSNNVSWVSTIETFTVSS